MMKRIDGWQQTEGYLSLEKIDKVATCTIIRTFTRTLSWMLRLLELLLEMLLVLLLLLFLLMLSWW